ncbi:hypothetical protein JW935_01035 [candidate division KSB1 bacterium]|nr:hypothetical protein [candidate division KSB1 bacterium]
MKSQIPVTTILTSIFVLLSSGFGFGVQLKWESLPNRSILSQDVTRELVLDQNGDGVEELVMMQKSEDGTVSGLVIVDGATQSIIAILVGLLDREGAVSRDSFKGFYDYDADGRREVLFANGKDIYLVDPLTDIIEFQLLGHFRLLGVSGDGNEGPVDLYIGDTEKNVIQIWGAGE